MTKQRQYNKLDKIYMYAWHRFNLLDFTSPTKYRIFWMHIGNLAFQQMLKVLKDK